MAPLLGMLFGLSALAAAVTGFLALGLAMERRWRNSRGAQALGALALLV